MTGAERLGLLALGAGGLYYFTRDEHGNVVPVQPGDGTEPATPVKTGAAAVRSRLYSSSRYQIRPGANLNLSYRSRNPTTGIPSGSGYSREVEEQILRDLKASWDSATGEAKKAVCQRLKAQFPGDAGVQAMNCDQTASMEFQALVSVVGAAAGGAICGPPCSIVGALVAAWAGPKLEEWADKAWGKIKDWGKDIGHYLNPTNWF